MKNMSKADIHALSEDKLWSILRSTNSMTERFANELTWAKEALRKLGHHIN